MSFTIYLPSLQNNNTTSLTQPIQSGATSGSILSSQGINVDDFYVFEPPTTAKAEALQILTIPDSTSITFTACTVSHAASIPITFTPYNEVQIFKGASETGPFTLYATIPIDFNQRYTSYSDPLGESSNYYYYTYYNSANQQSSTQSSIISASGYAFNSFFSLKKRASDLLKDNYEVLVSNDEMGVYINEKYSKLQNTMLQLNQVWGIPQLPYEAPVNVTTMEYALPSDCYQVASAYIQTSGYDYYPMQYGTMTEVLKLANRPFNNLQFTPMQYFGYPQVFWYLNGTNIGIYPQVAGTLKLYYYPVSIQLVNDTDVPITPINNFDYLLVNYALRRGYQKSSKSDIQRVEVIKKMEDEDDLIFKASLQRRQFQVPPHIETTDNRFMGVFIDDTLGY
jgi:hypothetical protein